MSQVETPPAIRMAGVSKSFGSITALHDFELEARPGRILCLLGPSGCGKTTALRVIAGFEQPDSGYVEINGRRVAIAGSSVPPERRKVGMVFQDVALFPHLTVRENVAYGIRRDPDRGVRVTELLDLIGLASDADRLPHQLSGGMQQRVAVVRALAPRPEVILFDEPFSNLDQALRTRLRVDVREILRQAHATALFVTHDQEEALSMGDDVCVMSRGYVEQCGVPEVIYAEPVNPFVAGFVGVANLVRGDSDGSHAITRFGAVALVGKPGTRPVGRALVVLRPEHFEIEEAADGPVTGAWRVIDRRFYGARQLIEIQEPNGERVWCDAGLHARRLTLGDFVVPSLKPIETVAFTVGAHATEPPSPAGAPLDVGVARAVARDH